MADNNNTIKPKFLSGGILRAKDLQRLADLIITKITGGKGIAVRKFGDRLVIENTRASGKNNAVGIKNESLVFVKPVEQPQSDGKMLVKEMMPTLSATNALSSFDMYMFGDKGGCTVSAIANSYGVSAFTLFNSSTGAGDLFVAGKVKNYSTGEYDFISVQPVFTRTEPCSE